MARVLHGMPLSTLPDPGELQPGDQIVAYREDTGMAYRSNISGLGEASNENIADAFSIAKTYAAGDYCIYNDILYVFRTAHTGEWSDGDVGQTTIGNEIVAATAAVNAELETTKAELESEMADTSKKVQSGTVSIKVPSNSYKDATVTFPYAFSSTPVVVCQFIMSTGYVGWDGLTIVVTSRSTTGCTIRALFNGSADTTITVGWIATTN